MFASGSSHRLQSLFQISRGPAGAGCAGLSVLSCRTTCKTYWPGGRKCFVSKRLYWPEPEGVRDQPPDRPLPLAVICSLHSATSSEGGSDSRNSLVPPTKFVGLRESGLLVSNGPIPNAFLTRPTKPSPERSTSS